MGQTTSGVSGTERTSAPAGADGTGGGATDAGKAAGAGGATDAGKAAGAGGATDAGKAAGAGGATDAGKAAGAGGATDTGKAAGAGGGRNRDGRIIEPQPAPVSDPRPDPRPAYGFELSRYMLAILAGSILLFWIFLMSLDIRTSGSLEKSYETILSASLPASSTPESKKIEFLAKEMRSYIENSGANELNSNKNDLEVAQHLLSDRLKIKAADTQMLSSCITLLEAPPTGDDGKKSPPATDEQKSTVSGCLKILDALQFSIGGPIDVDRLRLMRDFAQDMQSSHQAMRSFWISAVQLVLVNVLLPLLTALLGYMFGRQTANQNQ